MTRRYGKALRQRRGDRAAANRRRAACAALAERIL